MDFPVAEIENICGYLKRKNFNDLKKGT